MSKSIEELIKIRRSDKIYREVEEFQKYELISCLIYEMYIRTSPNLKTEYEKMNLIFRQNKDESFIYYQYKISDVILYEHEKQKFTLNDIIYSIFPQLYDLLEKFHNDKISSDYSFNLNFVIDEYVSKIGEKDIIFQEIIFRDKSKNEYIKMTKEKLKEYITNILAYTVVIPNYSRPQLYFKNNYFLTIQNLNISLPDEELFDFIKKLKTKMKISTLKIRNINSSQHMLLDETTSTFSLKLKNKNILRDSKKMADLFFIYDVISIQKNKNLSIGAKYEYIKTEISNNEEYPRIISNETISNYYRDAKSLIDDKGYEILIKSHL